MRLDLTKKIIEQEPIDPDKDFVEEMEEYVKKKEDLWEEVQK